MSYGKILVPLTGGVHDAHVLKAAFAIAEAFGNHVAGVYVKPDPADALRNLGTRIPASVVHQIINAANDAARNAAAGALAALERAAKSVGAPVGLPAGVGLSSSFHELEGSAEVVIAREARLSDLSVFGLPAENNDPAMRATLESVLLNGGKPVLLVPRETLHIVGTKIAVGWDGSAAAAHAVSSALPLMKRAEAIEILSVGVGPVESAHMDRLRDYLRLHGLNPVEHSVNPGSQGTAATLVDVAQRAGAGLLVLGGYGHSRLRELVLGGVTRHVLANVTMPVFMAH